MSKRASVVFSAAAMSLALVLVSATAKADVVVQGNTPQAQPAPAPAAPAPVVVQPQQTTTAPQAVEPVPSRRTTVVEHEDRNYMGTIFISALTGGLAGVLIGGALYYLADDQTHAVRIGYWAAGGVLVGTGVGLTQVLVQESRADRAVSALPSDPAPTFRLALFRKTF